MHFPVRASLFAAALACAAPFAAAQAQGDGPPASSWGLGLGIASQKKPYAGMDRDNQPLPIVQYENEYVRVFGPGVEVKLPGLQISATQKLNFGLVGQFDFSGYEAKDSVALSGMAERKGGLWLGARAEWENDVANVTAEWKRATGNSKGQAFSLGLERTWRMGPRVMLTPRLVATWHDSKYNDYYYGVRAGEARTGRAAYRGESGTNAELGVRGIYMFDRHHSLFLDLSVTRLSSAVKDSPLVDRSTENGVFLGYLYKF